MPKFIPRAEAEKRRWLLTLQQNLRETAQQMQLTPQQEQDLDAEITRAIEAIDRVNQTEAEAEAAKTARDEHRAEFFPQLNGIIQHWKTSPLYSLALGEKINIESPKIPKVSRTVRDLQAVVTAGVQEVQFVFKRPVGYSVAIYCRRASETDFALLKQISGKIAKDIRPNLNRAEAEKRDYYFVLVKNDEESSRSSVYSVAVAY